MKSGSNRTSGFFILSESFDRSMFIDSFVKFFVTGELGMGVQPSFEIVHSKEMKKNAVIDLVASRNKDGPSVSSGVEIGIDVISP